MELLPVHVLDGSSGLPVCISWTTVSTPGRDVAADTWWFAVRGQP